MVNRILRSPLAKYTVARPKRDSIVVALLVDEGVSGCYR